MPDTRSRYPTLDLLPHTPSLPYPTRPTGQHDRSQVEGTRGQEQEGCGRVGQRGYREGGRVHGTDGSTGTSSQPFSSHSHSHPSGRVVSTQAGLTSQTASRPAHLPATLANRSSYVSHSRTVQHDAEPVRLPRGSLHIAYQSVRGEPNAAQSYLPGLVVPGVVRQPDGRVRVRMRT